MNDSGIHRSHITGFTTPKPQSISEKIVFIILRKSIEVYIYEKIIWHHYSVTVIFYHQQPLWHVGVTHIHILILTHIPTPTLVHIHLVNHHQNHPANHHHIRLVVVLHEMGFEFSGLDQEVEFMFRVHQSKVGRKCHNQMQLHQLTMDLYIQV